jgi:tetratricopeptide (TPR) repeat protein
MGLAYGDLKEHKKAIDCYKKALEDENFDTPSYAWHNMGIAYGYLGEHEKAIHCYERAILYYPEDATVYNNLGKVLYKLKKPIDAEEQFRRAIQIEPYLAEPHYNLGIILTDEEYYEDAKKEYETALESEPTNADYLNSLGYVLVELGQYKKAKEYFEEAISSDPTHGKAHHNLAALKKISEAKYVISPLYPDIPALPNHWKLMLSIIFMIIITYYLLYDNKLSGYEFSVLIVSLMGLLTVIVLLPELKSLKFGAFEVATRETEGKPAPKSAESIPSHGFKVGPSGIEFSRYTEGKQMKPKSAELMSSPEFKR